MITVLYIVAMAAAWCSAIAAHHLGRLTERKVWLNKKLAYELERGELLDAEHEVRRAEFALFGSLLKESHPELVASMEALLARFDAIRARRGGGTATAALVRVPCKHPDERVFSNVAPARLCADCGAWRMDHDAAWRHPRLYDSQPDDAKGRST